MAVSTATISILLALWTATASAAPAVVYSNNFEGAVGPEWSNASTDTAPAGSRNFLGRFSNQTVSLSLASLSPHSNVAVSFELFIINSWDGHGQPFSGPDVWELSVSGGPTLLRTTFASHDPRVQAYPGAYTTDAGSPQNSPHTGAAEINSLGFPDFFGTGDVYNLCLTFPHMGNALVLDFAGSGLQGVGDESWGLDNVIVETDSGCPTVVELINDSLNLDSLNTAYNPADSRALAGVFTITATFSNISSNRFVDVFFETAELTRNNRVLNADDGPSGVGSIVSVPASVLGSNGVLDPGESFEIVFEIGLQEQKQFTFFVDAFGDVLGRVSTPPPAQPIASCRARLEEVPSSADGEYLVDPDGTGGEEPFSVYCDMTNGGWQLIYNRNNAYFTPDHMVQQVPTGPINFDVNSTAWYIPSHATQWRWESSVDAGSSWRGITTAIPSEALLATHQTIVNTPVSAVTDNTLGSSGSFYYQTFTLDDRCLFGCLSWGGTWWGLVNVTQGAGDQFNPGIGGHSDVCGFADQLVPGDNYTWGDPNLELYLSGYKNVQGDGLGGTNCFPSEPTTLYRYRFWAR